MGVRVAGGDLCHRQKHRPSRQARPRHYHHLRKTNRILFSQLTISGKMNGYLADIDKQAEEMFSQLVNELVKTEGITEKLKEAITLLLFNMNNRVVFKYIYSPLISAVILLDI